MVLFEQFLVCFPDQLKRIDIVIFCKLAWVRESQDVGLRLETKTVFVLVVVFKSSSSNPNKLSFIDSSELARKYLSEPNLNRIIDKS